jgi:hypothetical protein
MPADHRVRSDRGARAYLDMLAYDGIRPDPDIVGKLGARGH